MSDSIDLGPLADFQPLIADLRRGASAPGAEVGAYAFAYNRVSGERYFFGYDAAGREFAFRFTPDELTRFIAAAQGVASVATHKPG